ncbi:zinc ABC transporter substrate-binding protein AztC [Humidisolicoccus flavus]|uniref:zinc ABC transporter substrate-binding protein AztC n=1 Tax=Humidisolicoccus flavus TaxID=3111414 RepID=UPI003244A192
MKRRAALAAFVMLGLSLTACTTGAPPAASVVVTTNILGDVVEELVGDQLDVHVLMPPNADPHSFGVSAQDAALMRSASLLVSNGLGLEEGLVSHLDAATSDGVPLFEAGSMVEVMTHGEHGSPDPHFWTDPSQMIAVVEGIAEALEQHVPGLDEAALNQAVTHYTEELAALDSEMANAFETIPEAQRVLVTNHHVFGYLAAHFSFEVVGAIIPSGTTLASPSAADLEDLSNAITAHQVPAIFADSSQPDRLAQVLAEEASINVEVISLFTESLSAPGEGAETYLEMMRTNTERIVEGLAPSS